MFQAAYRGKRHDGSKTPGARINSTSLDGVDESLSIFSSASNKQTNNITVVETRRIVLSRLFGNGQPASVVMSRIDLQGR